MIDNDEIIRSVTPKMLVLKPTNNSDSPNIQIFINLYPREDDTSIVYGISELTSDSHILYVDSNMLIDDPDVQQLRTDINAELMPFAELGYHQVMITLERIDSKFNAKVSYYSNIFTKERNDPESELLFWRSQLGFKPENDEQQAKVDSVAKYFKD